MTADTAVEVPIIDVSGYLAGDVQAKGRIVNEFRDACENQGFLQVVGHSVPADLQSRYLTSLAQFFALPIKEKEKVALSKSECHRGYELIGAQKLEQLDENATADQKESFYVRRDRPLGRFLIGPNQWPDSPPQFKDVYMEYFESVHKLSKKLFRLMALSLDLDERYFDDFASDPDGTLARAPGRRSIRQLLTQIQHSAFAGRIIIRRLRRTQQVAQEVWELTQTLEQ